MTTLLTITQRLIVTWTNGGTIQVPQGLTPTNGDTMMVPQGLTMTMKLVKSIHQVTTTLPLMTTLLTITQRLIVTWTNGGTIQVPQGIPTTNGGTTTVPQGITTTIKPVKCIHQVKTTL